MTLKRKAIPSTADHHKLFWPCQLVHFGGVIHNVWAAAGQKITV